MPHFSTTIAEDHFVGHAATVREALFVGPWDRGEFSLATADWEEFRAWRCVANVSQACEMLRAEEMTPELLFVAQPFPDCVRQADVDRLQALAPLMRIVIVAGTWCEGSLRTGAPLSGVLRLVWYELSPWWQAARHSMQSGACPPWSAPLVHPQSGRLSVDLSSEKIALSGIVAIGATDFAVFESLSDALADYGLTTTWFRDEQIGDLQKSAAGIWDGGQLDERDLQRLTDFCRRIEGPVAVLLDFPRAEHFQLARSVGASAVFGKPYVVEEVVQELAVSLTD